MTNKTYRCCFTDAGDRIRSYQHIECANDTEAALKVDELLAASLDSSAELWLGERLVGKWSIQITHPCERSMLRRIAPLRRNI